MIHQSHADVVLRLKRARGHLDKVIAMIEDGEPCTSTAQQLHAVVQAIRSAKRVFVEDHIDYCATTSSIADLKEIAKYL